jgi:DNA-binding transcriptional LysR family regulator
MHFCMDWRSVKFDWNHARAFLVAAEEGSFSAAARALRTAQPTIGRQIAALEEDLGVALFERIGSRLALTPAGLDLVGHVRAMGDAQISSASAAGSRSRPPGSTWSVTCARWATPRRACLWSRRVSRSRSRARYASRRAS